MFQAKRGQMHKMVVRAVIEALNMRKDIWAWENNTGALKMESRFVRFGLKGSADILGLTSDGRIFCAEVKTGKAIQTPAQKIFEQKVKSFGGRYYLVRENYQTLLQELDKLNLPLTAS